MPRSQPGAVATLTARGVSKMTRSASSFAGAIYGSCRPTKGVLRSCSIGPKGVVAGKFKEKDTPLVLLDNVATEIASLFGPATAPQKVESATRPQMAVTRPPKPTKPSTTRNLEASEAPKVAVAPEAPKATASKSPASSADSLKH